MPPSPGAVEILGGITSPIGGPFSGRRARPDCPVEVRLTEQSHLKIKKKFSPKPR